jgi:hypothetical protein
MAKVSLKATGGLNKDVDLNLLPEGDYSDATNIIFDSGKTGGAGAIKMLESITTAGFNFGSDTIKATHQAADGQIYVLTVNGATAYIYRIPTTLDSKVTILSYTHSVSVDFAPDIKVLDNSIIWNYYANGTPLLFSLDGWTTAVVNPAIGDLTLVKRTPNNVFTVDKNQSTPDSGLEFLETRDFQFAGRYQYKSGEYSVLGAYSQMYKGADGVSSYTFTYSFTGAPTNAEYFELYTKIGNAGIWRRIDTAKIGTDTGLSWTGQIYESLDTVTTAKPFDAIPISAKHIEIAKNRVFLANIVDDYDVSSANLDFTITELITETPSDYRPSTTSGTHGTYLTTDNLAEAGISSKESTSTDYYKPFANDSTYGIGLAYYDEAMKTRGVEKYVKFKTGKFVYPILPTIRVGLNAGWAKPSWARYAQLVYTKNISKSYIYEGFASNIFFELTSLETDSTTKAVTEITTISQSITADQFKNVKFMVVDLMGMFRAGLIYNFSADDRITINTPNGLFDFKIDSQNDNFLYCKYDKGTMSNPVIPTSRNLYFEIYTPKQVPEDESLLFYEYGNLMDISSWEASTNKDISGAGTLNTNKLIGDMVFSKIDLPVYSTAPFIYNTTKSSPAIYADDAVTVANIAFASTMQSSLTNPGTASDEFLIPTYTSFGNKNDDEAVFINSSGVESATGPEVRISGFYDAADQEAGNKLIINYYIKASWVLRFDSLIPPATPSGSMRWVLTSQIYRVPYNNTTNTYGSAVVYGTEVGISDRTVTTATEGNSIDEIITQELLLSANANISANDKFYVRLKLTLTASGDIQQALINIAKQTSASNGIVMTLNGDRIKPIVNTTYNANSIISGATNKFVIRASSTATARPFWNTSAGKPTVLISKNLNPTGRKNTIRYGGNYVPGTKINNLSSFFALDSADVPIENGEIVSLQRASRLQGNGTMLLALCQNESAYLLLGEQELTQANNQGVLSISSNVIGTIRNLGYNYGLQDKQSSFNYKGNVWWWDNYNKKIVKYNEQGIELVSDNFMRSAFLTKSGAARFAFDPFYNMCFVSIGSETTSLGYSDTLKRWVSEYTFKTDFAESYGDKMVLFKSGVVYKSLQSGFNAFLGAAAVDSTIAFTLNSRLPIMPLNVSITHDMNVMDYSQANGVKANLLSIAISNENGQASAINETNFIAEDNRLYAHILRDSNSTGGLIEGNYIISYLTLFTVSLKDKTQNMRLNSLDIEVQPVSGHS